jgi:hypothetical protein
MASCAAQETVVVAWRYTLMTGEAVKKGAPPHLWTTQEDVDDPGTHVHCWEEGRQDALPARDDILRKASGMHTR